MRPARSGESSTTCRSKRPGRKSALSRISGRLVAARRMTPALFSNPSISANSWFKVCSRSSLTTPIEMPRCRRWRRPRPRRRYKVPWPWPARTGRERAPRRPRRTSRRSRCRIERRTERRPPGHRPSQQRLPGSRRAEQQDPFRDPTAQRRETARVLEERDELLELPLGFVTARNVIERDPSALLGDEPCPALAKAHHLATGTLRGASEEPQKDEDQDAERQQPRHQELAQRAARPSGVRNTLLIERGNELRVLDTDGPKRDRTRLRVDLLERRAPRRPWRHRASRESRLDRARARRPRRRPGVV